MTRRSTLRPVPVRPVPFIAALLMALALALAGCGRKGDLRPPEGEESAYGYPQAYPAPESVLPEIPGPAAEPREDATEEPDPNPEGLGVVTP